MRLLGVVSATLMLISQFGCARYLGYNLKTDSKVVGREETPTDRLSAPYWNVTWDESGRPAAGGMLVRDRAFAIGQTVEHTQWKERVYCPHDSSSAEEQVFCLVIFVNNFTVFWWMFEVFTPIEYYEFVEHRPNIFIRVFQSIATFVPVYPWATNVKKSALSSHSQIKSSPLKL